MEIANDRAHRCLKYVAQVEDQGYSLRVDDFVAYARGPSRRRRIPSFDAISQMQRALAYARPDEDYLEYLYRVGWVAIVGPGDSINDDDVVAMTDLGRAVLSALDAGSVDQELAAAVVLDQGDPVGRARVIGEIARHGDCALVDRFFGIQDFLDIVQRTEVTRVLTGTGGKDKLPSLQQALSDVSVDRKFEVRLSNAFHDRYVVPQSGPVLALGTSLGGVSKRVSTLITIQDDAGGSAVRLAFEEEWKRAEPLAPVSSDADGAGKPKEGYVAVDEPAPSEVAK